MLDLLTQYLSQTNSVTIPQVGSLTLERQPAAWSVVDQSLQGPAYHVRTGDGVQAAAQQVYFLAEACRQSEWEAQQKLDQFGEEMLTRLKRAPFLWPGVGLLHWQEGHLELQPHTPVTMPSFPAARVIREDARHSIRVGENQVDSNFYEERAVEAEGRNDLEWLAWLLAVLAAIFVFYCMYSGGFSPLSGGLQTPATNSLP
ncbi:MAG: hypothetical protein EOO08_02510 [Chitinophagaceae bacterium]|nr:MAG: hypothetical protein EOO08_02510 [Chitinophagaceae bacterium]